MSTSVQKIGLWTAVALVVGNMIGSGLFLLPAALAPYGSGSLLGWAITGAGAILLALVFARLGLLLPHSGGPYIFVRSAFGDAAGFLVAWGYWIAIWCGDAAVAIAFAGAAQQLLPSAMQSPQIGMVLAIAAIWICTASNLRGVSTAGLVQLISTILKLAPLFLLVAYALAVLAVEPRPLPAIRPDPNTSLTQTALATGALCLWAFLGLESATNAAGSVRDPERTVPRATLIGTVIAVIATVLACYVVMLLVPGDTLKQSTAPFVDAATMLWGNEVALLFAAAAAVSAFGTLNGWIMMQGQIPLAIARDGLFPKVFAQCDAHGTPQFGLLIGSGLTTGLVIANFNEGLVSVFTFSILLSTAAILVPYVLCAAALMRLAPVKHWSTTIVCVLALMYGLWALWGTGTQSLLWGSVLFALGLPVYWMMRSAAAVSR